jgi:type II secretory pathway component PulJ
MGARAGFTTVEGLVAIVLLSLAALGAAGSMARSSRILGVAGRNAAAARATERAMEQLGAQLRAAGNRCAAGGPGAGASGETVISWTAVMATGGLEFTFVTVHPASQGIRSDTLWLFLPCR